MEPIKDYFLIGDLHTAALVSAKGSIDWMCLPHFDSPSVFAAILGQNGGKFAVDAKGYEASAAYVPDTAIVDTKFEGKEHSFALRDFMLPRPTEEVVPHLLVRKIIGTKGSAAVKFIYDPRPKYAARKVLAHHHRNILSVRLEERSIWLHLPKGASVRRRTKGTGFLITIDVKEGETSALIMEMSHESRLRRVVRDLELETIHFWQDWVAQGKFFEFCRDDLVRSAITLKLMQFYPTGGLIAAPTASLPEEIGGVRNWDYRYVWMRDATFTLYAFSVLGYHKEAEKFFHYLETIVEEAQEMGATEIDLALMYTVWGQPVQSEYVLQHLSGYRNSQPVRIGNGAAEQFQFDLYGSLIDAYYFAWKDGLKITTHGRAVIRALVEKIERRWLEPDSGIWEVRSGVQQFTYSKVMAWIGVDRALRLGEAIGLDDETRRRWEALREQIHAWIWEHCYDAARGTFRQHPGSESQDASNFLFILLHFMDRGDERSKKMVAATAAELSQKDMFIYRYRAEDGLRGGEGAFILCSYWYIAALAAIGEVEQAKKLFSRLRASFAPSGLIAEEIDPETGEYLGNFPQAFSHIGLILAARYIHRYGAANT